MDCAVDRSEDQKNPGAGHIRTIDVTSYEQVQTQRVKNDRHLEQVSEIVRRKADRLWSNGCSFLRRIKILRIYLVLNDPTNSPGVHHCPDNKRQHQHSKKRRENFCALHTYLRSDYLRSQFVIRTSTNDVSPNRKFLVEGHRSIGWAGRRQCLESQF
jgi:hypothetical protein